LLDPDPDKSGWNASQRGAGYLFGSNVVKKFLHTNSFETISRAHQLCMDGYQVLFDDSLCTIWSAPNYCYRCGNIASVMEVSEGLNRNFNTFDASPDNEKSKPEMEEAKEIPDYFL
jgi:serine/threonine-protein phosphatase PPG1